VCDVTVSDRLWRVLFAFCVWRYIKWPSLKGTVSSVCDRTVSDRVWRVLLAFCLWRYSDWEGVKVMLAVCVWRYSEWEIVKGTVRSFCVWRYKEWEFVKGTVSSLCVTVKWEGDFEGYCYQYVCDGTVSDRVWRLLLAVCVWRYSMWLSVFCTVSSLCVTV